MNFAASKLIWAVMDPAALLFMALVAGTAALWTRRWRGGRAIVGGAVVGILFLGVVPVGDWLLIGLENRFPRVEVLSGRVDGIIVLGGFADQFVTTARGQPSVNGSIERLTEFMALADRHPDARLVVAGGSGDPFRQDLKESLVTRRFMAQWGFDADRVVFEDRSRNTYENAAFAKALARPVPGERWVLITSAFHMPRAVAVFRAAGWPVIPYPVDYLTEGRLRWRPRLNPVEGLASLWVTHEWAGLLAYRLMGRTSSLFPAPSDP
ncbi:MAG: YdcF family protein [Alphaproteobacteria bacterium]|nr:YdcF family protein [Alphaproteobacteria bacterium]